MFDRVSSIRPAVQRTYPEGYGFIQDMMTLLSRVAKEIEFGVVVVEFFCSFAIAFVLARFTSILTDVVSVLLTVCGYIRFACKAPVKNKSSV